MSRLRLGVKMSAASLIQYICAIALHFYTLNMDSTAHTAAVLAGRTHITAHLLTVASKMAVASIWTLQKSAADLIHTACAASLPFYAILVHFAAHALALTVCTDITAHLLTIASKMAVASISRM